MPPSFVTDFFDMKKPTIDADVSSCRSSMQLTMPPARAISDFRTQRITETLFCENTGMQIYKEEPRLRRSDVASSEKANNHVRRVCYGKRRLDWSQGCVEATGVCNFIASRLAK